MRVINYGLALLCSLLFFTQVTFADDRQHDIGIVIMHGKGSSPTKHVSGLAMALQEAGFMVENIEMPWSGNRDYDTDVAGAESEVLQALAKLKSRGAGYTFVAGHSQGGIFALYFAGKYACDGVIAIAPGGNVASTTFKEKLGDSLAEARQYIAEGKGQEKVKLADFEGSKGTYPILTTPEHYVTWFDPNGAMNERMAVQHVKQETPVLFIAPTGDYPGLAKVKQEMFDALPKTAMTSLYEPDTNHLGSPSASSDKIADWMLSVVYRHQENGGNAHK